MARRKLATSGIFHGGQSGGDGGQGLQVGRLQMLQAGEERLLLFRIFLGEVKEVLGLDLQIFADVEKFRYQKQIKNINFIVILVIIFQ